MLQSRLAASWLALLFSLPTIADVLYRSVDEDGHVVFTNLRPKSKAGIVVVGAADRDLPSPGIPVSPAVPKAARGAG